jgi:hypothetical protein
LFFCCLLCITSGNAYSKEVLQEKTFENGVLFKVQNIHVVRLCGSYHQMGREYGALLHDQLAKFYDEIIKLVVNERKIPMTTVNKIAEDLFQRYPERFKEVLYGMSETSGLSLQQHLIINAFEYYIYTSAFDKFATSKCSAIAAWGAFTEKGDLIFGRNYDFDIDISRFKKFLVVAAFNPEGSGNSVAIVTFAGTLNATTDINNKKIFLELNSAGNMVNGLHYYDRIPAPIELFAIMTDSSDLSQIDRQFHTINSDSSFIVNVSDPSVAYSYEWPPLGVKRVGAIDDGLLVVTNNFLDQSWSTYDSHDNADLTLTRRRNLIDLAEQYKGKINIKIMQHILDMGIKQNGATFYDIKNEGLYTGFQVLVSDQNSILWVKVPGVQDWVPINLSILF